MISILAGDDLHAGCSEVRREIEKADMKYGPFASAHEGYGVLCEEMAELLSAIRANKGASIQEEAIQVAAVALRIAECLEYPESAERSGVS